MTRWTRWLLGVWVLALLAGMSAPARAADEEKVRGRIKSLRADKNEFVMTDSTGKNWNFHVDVGAKVYVKDKESKFSDLQVDDHVLVTYKTINKKPIAREIKLEERTDTETAVGKIKSLKLDKDQMVLTAVNKKNYTFLFGPAVRVVIGGKEGKRADLKEGDEISIDYFQDRDNKLIAREVRKK
jgi:hypothetical protein